MERDFLPYSTPEREGVSSRELLRLFHEWREREYFNSILIARHGKVILEHYCDPYGAETPHMLFSITKSFVSLAIGYAESEGLLSLDDPAIRFFPELRTRAKTEALERITIRHLLTMTGGHGTCPLAGMDFKKLLAEKDYVKVFFDAPFVFQPGEKFVYNSGGTHVLSAIIRQAAKVNFSEYLRPRLLDPLQIHSFSVRRAPDGVEMGGWGGSATTRDLLKFGQCILQKGVWQGKEIIPPKYLEQATSFQADNNRNTRPDWNSGYGYCFWLSRHGFRADGSSGQYCIVLPEEDMTLAITSGMRDMGKVLDSLWEFLPSLYDAPRMDKPEDQALLKAFLEEKMHIPVCPSDCPPRPVEFRNFVMQSNACGIRSVGCAASEHEVRLVFDGPRGREELRSGFGHFVHGELFLAGLEPHKVASSAGWRTPELLEIRLVLTDSPYLVTYLLDFSGGGLRFSRTSNIHFLNPDWPELHSEP